MKAEDKIKAKWALVRHHTELVEVALSGDDEPHVATIAFRAIIAVYPETVNEGDAVVTMPRDVVTIAIEGGHIFHVAPHEGEVVRELWTRWTNQ